MFPPKSTLALTMLGAYAKRVISKLPEGSPERVELERVVLSVQTLSPVELGRAVGALTTIAQGKGRSIFEKASQKLSEAFPVKAEADTDVEASAPEIPPKVVTIGPTSHLVDFTETRSIRLTDVLTGEVLIIQIEDAYGAGDFQNAVNTRVHELIMGVKC